MIYCDASVLVAGLTREADTERVLAWIAERKSGELCISGWVITEFAGAVATKLRRRELPTEERGAVQASWRKLIENSLSVCEIPSGAFEQAARFCEMKKSSLRPGDALHLAIASLGGHSLATLDRGMAEAAIVVGVAVEEMLARS